MSCVNRDRVVLGGLLAGLVINVGKFILNHWVLKTQWEAAVRAAHLPPPGDDMGWFVISGFLGGILAVWLYAAVRTRLGPGLKTAATVGASVWALTIFPAMMPPSVTGVLPNQVVRLANLWDLVLILLATVIGAWVYKEGNPTCEPG